MFLRLLRWLLIEPTPSAPAELAPRFLAPITDRDAALPPAPSLPDLGAGPGCGYCAPEWPCREHAGFGPGEGPKFCDCQFPEDCQNGCEWLTAEQAEELGPGDVDDDGCLWLAPG